MHIALNLVIYKREILSISILIQSIKLGKTQHHTTAPGHHINKNVKWQLSKFTRSNSPVVGNERYEDISF